MSSRLLLHPFPASAYLLQVQIRASGPEEHFGKFVNRCFMARLEHSVRVPGIPSFPGKILTLRRYDVNFVPPFDGIPQSEAELVNGTTDWDKLTRGQLPVVCTSPGCNSIVLYGN